MSESRTKEGFWAKMTGAGTAVLVIIGVIGLHVFSGGSVVKGHEKTRGSPVSITPPTLDLSSSSGPPGSRLTVSGDGFGAGERINISFQGSLIAHAIADQRGSYSTSITVPSLGGQTGNMVIVAVGTTNGRSAEEPFDLT